MDQRRQVLLFDLLPQIADIYIEEIVITKEILSPDAAHDFLTFQHPSSASHQEIQQVIFLD